jgi:hypothetical protein
VRALAISIPVTAAVATLAVGPFVIGRLDWELLIAGIGAERTGGRVDLPDGVSITAPINALDHGTQP